MACIAAVVLVDGFQHLEDEFFTKALAFGSVWHQTFNLCRFDSTDLLLQFPRAIVTYRHQSRLHGWELNATGLPQFAVITALLAFIQDMLLDEFEQGRSVPVALTLWAKGYQQHAIFLALVATLDPLTVPILVRNLEDLSCPPARLLIPGERVLTTFKKIATYLEWIHDHHLGWPASPVHWTLVIDLLIGNFYLWTFLSFLCFFRRGRLNLRWEKC